MKRRTFVRGMAVAGVGIGVTGLSACSTSANKDKATTENRTAPFFKLSLAQWSIHRMIQKDHLDPYQFAAKAKGWGFEGLEYVSHLYQPKLEEASSLNIGIQNMVAELNKRKDEHGIENLMMMVDLPPGEGDMAVLDKAKRNKAVEKHYPWVDATNGLGCHSMRVNMFGEFEAANWKMASIEALRKLGEYAASQNVNILVENHGWLTSNAALLMEVINETGLTNVGTLPDFGNFCTKRKDMERWGECEEEYDKYKGIKELMPAARAVSAKSYDFDEEGQTTIDYVRMLQIVKDAGYTGYIGVEYEGNNLSEEEGILATKNLLLNAAKELQ
ncbi:MAG: sugar phosphate isomerase/epimerase [Ekhidna sp.]|nr:sugar phosphate isomerase/epimerase [Ekhidna sp.]